MFFYGVIGPFISFFFFTCSRRCRSSRLYNWLSINGSYLPCCPYFVFKYITPIIGSCWSYYFPQSFWCVPRNFCPTHIVMVELNWVILRWSCGNVDEVSRIFTYCSPPGFLEVYQRYVSFSSIGNGVG